MDKSSTNLQPHENSFEDLSKRREAPQIQQYFCKNRNVPDGEINEQSFNPLTSRKLNEMLGFGPLLYLVKSNKAGPSLKQLNGCVKHGSLLGPELSWTHDLVDSSLKLPWDQDKNPLAPGRHANKVQWQW